MESGTAYIKRAVLDIVLRTDDATATHSEYENIISQALQQELGTFIEEEIRKLIPDNRRIVIDTLSIDLGTIVAGETRSEFLSRFRSNFPAALRKSIPDTPEQPDERELIQYFLQNGHYPWWTSHAASQDLNMLLKRLPEKTFRQLADWIMQQRKQPGLLKRLHAQLETAILHSITEAMTGNVLQELLPAFRHIDAVFAQHDPIAIGSATPSEREHLGWMMRQLQHSDTLPAQTETWQRLYVQHKRHAQPEQQTAMHLEQLLKAAAQNTIPEKLQTLLREELQAETEKHTANEIPVAIETADELRQQFQQLFREGSLPLTASAQQHADFFSALLQAIPKKRPAFLQILREGRTNPEALLRFFYQAGDAYRAALYAALFPGTQELVNDTAQLLQVLYAGGLIPEPEAMQQAQQLAASAFALLRQSSTQNGLAVAQTLRPFLLQPLPQRETVIPVLENETVPETIKNAITALLRLQEQKPENHFFNTDPDFLTLPENLRKQVQEQFRNETLPLTREAFFAGLLFRRLPQQVQETILRHFENTAQPAAAFYRSAEFLQLPASIQSEIKKQLGAQPGELAVSFFLQSDFVMQLPETERKNIRRLFAAPAAAVYETPAFRKLPAALRKLVAQQLGDTPAPEAITTFLQSDVVMQLPEAERKRVERIFAATPTAAVYHTPAFRDLPAALRKQIIQQLGDVPTATAIQTFLQSDIVKRLPKATRKKIREALAAVKTGIPAQYDSPAFRVLPEPLRNQLIQQLGENPTGTAIQTVLQAALADQLPEAVIQQLRRLAGITAPPTVSFFQSAAFLELSESRKKEIRDVFRNQQEPQSAVAFLASASFARLSLPVQQQLVAQLNKQRNEKTPKTEPVTAPKTETAGEAAGMTVFKLSDRFLADLLQHYFSRQELPWWSDPLQLHAAFRKLFANGKAILPEAVIAEAVQHFSRYFPVPFKTWVMRVIQLPQYREFIFTTLPQQDFDRVLAVVFTTVPHFPRLVTTIATRFANAKQQTISDTGLRDVIERLLPQAEQSAETLSGTVLRLLGTYYKITAAEAQHLFAATEQLSAPVYSALTKWEQEAGTSHAETETVSPEPLRFSVEAAALPFTAIIGGQALPATFSSAEATAAAVLQLLNGDEATRAQVYNSLRENPALVYWISERFPAAFADALFSKLVTQQNTTLPQTGNERNNWLLLLHETISEMRTAPVNVQQQVRAGAMQELFREATTAYPLDLIRQSAAQLKQPLAVFQLQLLEKGLAQHATADPEIVVPLPFPVFSSETLATATPQQLAAAWQNEWNIYTTTLAQTDSNVAATISRQQETVTAESTALAAAIQHEQTPEARLEVLRKTALEHLRALRKELVTVAAQQQEADALQQIETDEKESTHASGLTGADPQSENIPATEARETMLGNPVFFINSLLYLLTWKKLPWWSPYRTVDELSTYAPRIVRERQRWLMQQLRTLFETPERQQETVMLLGERLQETDFGSTFEAGTRLRFGLLLQLARRTDPALAGLIETSMNLLFLPDHGGGMGLTGDADQATAVPRSEKLWQYLSGKIQQQTEALQTLQQLAPHDLDEAVQNAGYTERTAELQEQLDTAINELRPVLQYKEAGDTNKKDEEQPSAETTEAISLPVLQQLQAVLPETILNKLPATLHRQLILYPARERRPAWLAAVFTFFALNTGRSLRDVLNPAIRQSESVSAELHQELLTLRQRPAFPFPDLLLEAELQALAAQASPGLVLPYASWLPLTRVLTGDAVAQRLLLVTFAVTETARALHETPEQTATRFTEQLHHTGSEQEQLLHTPALLRRVREQLYLLEPDPENKRSRSNYTDTLLQLKKQQAETAAAPPAPVPEKLAAAFLQHLVRDKQLLQTIVNNETTKNQQQLAEKKPDEPIPYLTETPAPGEPIFIFNAGLVLLWPFIGGLFRKLQYVAGKAFVDKEKQERAVVLLQYIIDEQHTHPPEHLLPLNKLLCGMQPSDPIERMADLTDEEKEEAVRFLAAVKSQWEQMKNTSVDTFRRTFLKREGSLVYKNDNWELQVQPIALDVLLKKLPWGVSTVKFAWTQNILFVKWKM